MKPIYILITLALFTSCGKNTAQIPAVSSAVSPPPPAASATPAPEVPVISAAPPPINAKNEPSQKPAATPLPPDDETHRYDDWPVRPFDETIPPILEQHINLMADSSEKIPLPGDYFVLQHSFGDLNGDGKDDAAVVVEQRPGEYQGTRTAYILLAQEDETYAVCWQNNTILGRQEGGVFSDPFSEILIEGGTVTINHFGGSAERWGYSESYGITEGELVLKNARERYISIHTLCGNSINYNVSTGVIETRSDSPNITELDRLLLRSESTIPGQVFKFAESFRIFHLERTNAPYQVLPTLERNLLKFGEPAFEDLAMTASEALDRAMESLFPAFEKTPHAYTKEILNNYSAILCYEVPDYYYTDGNETLLYMGLNLYKDKPCHNINLHNNDTHETLYIEIDDMTGEITVAEDKFAQYAATGKKQE